MLSRQFAFWCSLVLIAPAAIAQSEPLQSSSDLQQATTPQAEADRQQQVAEWIEQLDSPKFSQRVHATRRLQQLGADAIKPLESVVLRGDSDAANRALDILQKHLASDSPALSTDAREALQRVADNKDHPQSRAAKKILTPVEAAPKTPNARPRLAVPQFAIPRQAMNQQIRVQVKSVNGKRDISVEENGRKFRFKDNNGGLTVERPDGKGGVKKSDYKNEEEFKKADGEAYKIYQRYGKHGKNGNRIQIRINGGVFPPRMQLRPLQLPQQRRIAPPAIEIQPRQKTPAEPVPPRTVPKPDLNPRPQDDAKIIEV